MGRYVCVARYLFTQGWFISFAPNELSRRASYAKSLWRYPCDDITQGVLRSVGNSESFLAKRKHNACGDGAIKSRRCSFFVSQCMNKVKCALLSEQARYRRCHCVAGISLKTRSLASWRHLARVSVGLVRLGGCLFATRVAELRAFTISPSLVLLRVITVFLVFWMRRSRRDEESLAGNLRLRT